MDTNEKVAIKRIPKPPNEDSTYKRKYKQMDEVKVLAMLYHPKIIKLKDFFETRDALYIVQELYDI